MPREGNAIDCVSVIVPTYNSARTLRLCLESVRNQNYACKEILVVDNYSRDETQSIAASFGAQTILFRGTQAAARNLGLTQSKGNYVLFLDSDQQLEPTVIAECVKLCLKGKVDAVKIPEVFQGLNFWGKSSALWKNSMVQAWGPNGGIPRFYRKKLLLDQLAFDGELRWWEDMELYRRLKSRGLKDAWCHGKVTHREATSPKQSISKYHSYGQSVTSFRGKEAQAPYAETLNLTLSTLAQLPKQPQNSPAVLLGCLFLVTVKTFSATFGFLSALR